MAYEKQTWEDRQVENPLTFTQTNNLDGSITLTPYPGAVQSEGSKMSAERLNHMEEGIYNNSILIEKIEEMVTGTVLYENANGTNAKTIELTQSVEDFNYIEIFFKLISSGVSYYSYNKVNAPNGKEVALNVTISTSGGAAMVYGVELIAFSGTTATTRRNYTFINPNEGKKNDNEMYVLKILGHK